MYKYFFEDRKDFLDKSEKTNLIMKNDGIRVMHMYSPFDNLAGGVTVAFTEYGDSITVAVATCKKGEAFDRRLGKVLAVGRFLNGISVRIPNSEWNKAEYVLYDIFAEC